MRLDQRLVRAEFTFGHSEVVELMMVTLHHNPHEAEALNFEHLLGVSACHHELDAARKLLGCRAPAKFAQFMRVRGYNMFDGIERLALAGHRDLQSVIELTFARDGFERDLVHVNKVCAQGGDVDL
jgi:hypothetical protein